MEKGSADKPESPACGTSSPTSTSRQQSSGLAGPQGRPVGKTSLRKEVAGRDGVESTNLFTNDAAISGGAELGSTDTAKDVSSTSHADSSLRGSRHRRHKLKSFSSKASRHLHRHQCKELAKLTESREAPNTTSAVPCFESPRTEHEGDLARGEATRPEASDTSRKKPATASQKRESPYADSYAHATSPETPELCSALGSGSKNVPKKLATSSILKKRTQQKKPVLSPPWQAAVTPHLGQSDEGNPTATDECATSACENLMTASTGSKGASSPHMLSQMSSAFDQTPPELGQMSQTFNKVSSPSVQVSSGPVPVAVPLVHNPIRSSTPSVVAPKATPEQPSHVLPPGPPSSPEQRCVTHPPELYASPAAVTGDFASSSTAPRVYGQPADALVSNVSEVNSAMGPLQPLHSEMMPPVIDSNAQSPNANLSGGGSKILSQDAEKGSLRRRKQTETSPSKRKTASVRFGATTFWEITLASVPRLTASPLPCGLCCLIAVCSATLVSLALVFFTNRSRPTYIDECNSTACVRANSSFWALIDDAVDPCQDFYGHVCRRWDNITGGRLMYLDHSVRQIARRVNQSLHDVDEFGGSSHDTRGVGQFYKLCLRFVTAPDRAISRAEIMRSFGAEKRDRLLTLTNFTEVVAALTDLSISRGLNTVFGVKLVRRAGLAVLNVFPGKTLAEAVGSRSTAAWRGYLNKLLAEVVAAYPSQKLDVYSVQKMDDTVRQLLESPDIGDEVREHVAAGSLTFMGDSTSANGWLAAVNYHLTTDEQLSSKTEVLVTSYRAVRNVLQFLRSLADYGVSYLYLHLLLEVFRFDYVRSLQHRSAVDLVRECLQASQDAMWHTRDVLTTNIFGGRSEGIRESANILHLVAEATSSKIGHLLSWMGEAICTRAHKTLSKVSLHVHDWCAGNYTGAAIGQHAEALLSGARAVEFPSIYVRLKEEQHIAFLKNIHADSDADDTLHVLDTGVQYDAGTDEMVVPASLRVEPVLYTRDVPFAFVAGTLGALVATELYRAVIPGPLSSAWHLQQRAIMNKIEDCAEKLADDALNISLPALNDTLAEGDGLPAHIFWMLAARTAYEALRLATLSFRRAINWPSYWKKWQRIFFGRFCFLTCGSEDEDSRQAGASIAQEKAVSECPSVYYTALDHTPPKEHHMDRNAARPPDPARPVDISPRDAPASTQEGKHPLTPSEPNKDERTSLPCDGRVLVYLIVVLALTVALAVVLITSSSRTRPEELTTPRSTVARKEKRSVDNSDALARSRNATGRRQHTTVFAGGHGTSVAQNYSAVEDVAEKDELVSPS
ncbi:hypothetical protein MTO96_020753 [Rhipicephalus appendiculatus]